MDVIRRRTHKNRSDDAVWYLDSTHKLVKCKFSVSGAADGCSLCIMWLKCSNNSRGNDAYHFFTEAINKCVTPL